MGTQDRSRSAFRTAISDLDGEASEDEFRRAGTRAAFAFSAFAHWIEVQAENRGLKSLFLLSREGPFLKAILRQCGASSVHIDVLEVSRVSTFLPSMPDFGMSTMMRIWERFPRQAPSSMLSSLGLDPAEFAPLLRRFDLDPEQPIFEPWRDPRIREFLEHGDFIQRAMAERDESKELLLTYLRSKGYFQTKSVGLVDVGWRGTIQDSLARLAPSVHSTGLFLAHRPANLPQYDNTQKVGFLAGRCSDASLFGQELRLAASPLEMLCTCPGGSVVAYQFAGDGVVPIRRPIEREEALLRGDVDQFQTAVLDSLEAAAPSVTTADTEHNRAIATMALKSVLFDPAPEIVEVFEQYQLDGSIGGTESGPAPWYGFSSILTASGRGAVKESVQKHGWPHSVGKRMIGARAFGLLRTASERLGRAGRWLV